MNRDDRGTPPELFWRLHQEFGFTLDACASDDNALLPRYNTEERPDRYSWVEERVFCNPPFSALETWVKRAHYCESATVCMLIPANRTEQPFWQTYIEPFRDQGGRLSTRFIAGRTRFMKDGKQMGSPNFACVLLMWGSKAKAPRCVECLREPMHAGLCHP